MEASVYMDESGVLIVDFVNVKYSKCWRDVVVQKCTDGTLIVRGNKANYQDCDSYEWPFQRHGYHPKPELVLEEYVETVTEVVKKKRWYNFRMLSDVVRTYDRTREGWVEMKETNISTIWETSNWQIRWRTAEEAGY